MATVETENVSIPPITDALLDTPLAYILAVHDRHRAICAYLVHLARAKRIDAADIQMLIDYFDQEVPLHHNDEIQAFCPALRRRSLADREFIASIDRLEAHHIASNVVAREIAEGFRRILGDTPARLSDVFTSKLQEYAESEHKSLVYENAVILAIAEVRLKKADLLAISQDMKSRRGLEE